MGSNWAKWSPNSREEFGKVISKNTCNHSLLAPYIPVCAPVSSLLDLLKNKFTCNTQCTIIKNSRIFNYLASFNYLDFGVCNRFSQHETISTSKIYHLHQLLRIDMFKYLEMLPVMKTIMNHKIQFQLLTRINLSQHMSYVPSPSNCWMCIVTNRSWSVCVPYLSTPQVLEFRSMVHCNQVHAKNLISNCPHLKTYITLKLYGSITLCHILKQILWNIDAIFAHLWMHNSLQNLIIFSKANQLFLISILDNKFILDTKCM